MSLSPVEELRDFPCSFNLEVKHKVSKNRFQSTEKKLKEELGWDNLTTEEKVRILNLLTWVTFSLHKENGQAVEYNEQALMLSSTNLTAICNRIFISFEIGDKLRYEEDLKFLKGLKEQENFDLMKTEALAEQAFAYVKLGLVHLHPKCRELLSDCTDKCPDNYLWKLDLGLVCARLTQSNFNFTAGDTLTVEELMNICVKQLRVVSENASPRLRGLAYAELASLRQHNRQPEWHPLFENMSVDFLWDMALSHGSEDPVVLALCGNCYKGISVAIAIRNIKKSLKLRPTSKAYHQLGLCYLKKAEHCSRSRQLVRRSTNQNRRNNSASKQFLKMYAFANLFELEKDNKHVTNAVKCYQKAIETSFEVNMSARQCLGELYYRVKNYPDALKEFNHIIRTPDSDVTHTVTLISAHHLAGRSLLMIPESPETLQEAEEHFIKTVSLAASLDYKYPEYKNCIKEVWDAYQTLVRDNEDKEMSVNVFREIENVLNSGLGISNVDMLKRYLNGCLTDRKYEKALAYLYIAMAKRNLRRELRTNSELLVLQSKIYIGTSWSRLVKGSADFKALFQQMFELTYGYCAGAVDEATEQCQLRKNDVLVLYHESSNGKTLANNLSKVFELVFGLQISLKMEGQTGDTAERKNVDLLLQEMADYSVTLLIVNDSDPGSYSETVSAALSDESKNILIIGCGKNQHYPSNFNVKKRLNLTDAPWSEMKLMEAPLEVDIQENEVEESSGTDIVKRLFNGDVEAVMRLFCLIVKEAFQRHFEDFNSQL